MKRVNLYIDGYNFYYAITKAAKDDHKFDMHVGHAWCNFKKLAEEQLLLPGEQLDKIVYCTAKVKSNKTENQETYPREKKRQKLWLDCLEKYIPSIEIIYGIHRLDPEKEEKRRIQKELKKIIDYTNANEFIKIFKKILTLIKPKRKEKMTDVNIAVEMTIDGLCREKNMDIAILITEDADLLPAVRALCKRPEELGTKPVDVRVYIPIPKNKNQWDNLKRDYELTCLTTNKLTADQLAKSVLPYPPKNNRESFDDEKILDESITKKIYEEDNPLDRYWTDDAIKAYKRDRHEFFKNGITCNITTDELEKTNAPDWKKTPVYDYQNGEWIVYGEIEK